VVTAREVCGVVPAETPATRLFVKLSAEKQNRILQAAIEEFADKGYASASMNVVVDKAGISKGALFKYFQSKEELFGYIYRMALEQTKDTLREVRERSKGEDFFARLQGVMAAGLHFIRKHPQLARIYFRMIYTGDSPFRNEILRELYAESLDFIQSLVVDGIQRGDLRRDLNPQMTAFVLQCVLDHFLQAHDLDFLDPGPGFEASTPLESDRWIQGMIQLFQDGMGSHATSRIRKVRRCASQGRS
jgi:AcrR family transcriptional regulator